MVDPVTLLENNRDMLQHIWASLMTLRLRKEARFWRDARKEK